MKRDNFWFAFEPNRWLSNEKLALVSLGAKGLWIHLLCLMYKAEAEGKLTINGNPPTPEQISRMIGEDARPLLKELEVAGVYELKDGAIYHKGVATGLAKMKDRSDGYARRMTSRCSQDAPKMNHLEPQDDPSIVYNNNYNNNKSKREAKKEGLRPTRSDWSAYAKEIGWGTTDAESAFDYYESNGWKIGGKTPVKDWRACARNCQRRNQTTNKKETKPMNDNHRNSCYSPPTYKVMGYKCREDWVKAGCP
jgi:hypothetical protein